eukprot:5522554-Alexandrium_andersonii.AAC.1
MGKRGAQGAGKAKAKGKAVAKTAESEEGPPAKMQRNEMSKMLNYLRYHSEGKSKSPKDYQDECSQALNRYAALNGPDKHAFLEKFMAGNKKDLSWTKQFTSSELKTNYAI